MMRLPVEHQCHCILSLLITPHSAIPHYELPLAFFFFFFVSSRSADSQNLSQRNAIVLRLIEHFTGSITVCMYVCMYVSAGLQYKKERIAPLTVVSSSYLATPPDVSAVSNKSTPLLSFLSHSVLSLTLTNRSTRFMFCYWKSCHTLSSCILKSKFDQRSWSCSVLIFQCRTLA